MGLSPEKSKRRLWGRSVESAQSAPGGGGEREREPGASSPLSALSEGNRSTGGVSATETGSVRSRHARKKSVDGGAAPSDGASAKRERGERLSIFGGISGSIRAGRKPAPRYSACVSRTCAGVCVRLTLHAQGDG
jgi:hypothetical protein